jgi:pimeloyl-ACP methyl ester carboxylesterase
VLTKEIELSAGTIDYLDTGGDGSVIVLVHGLMMDSTLWDAVVGQLSVDHRCVVPILPMGAHRRPMPEAADLSIPGIAKMVIELMIRLDLTDVTLVGNDTGGAIVQQVICTAPERIGRIVLASCDAFDNFPPGLTGKTIVLAGKLSPTLFGLFMQQLRVRPIRRLPLAFGWLTKRGDAVTASWIKPVLGQPGIRRDAVKVLRAIAVAPTLLVDLAAALPGFDRPALIVWATQDRVMPTEHGRSLAQIFPRGRLVEVNDSYTLIPLDQPARFAALVRGFAIENAA